MNGTDHRPIMAGLHRTLKDVGLSEKPRIGSLAEYIKEALPLALPEWRGGPRSPHRSPLLVGCDSARNWIKREDQAVSSELEPKAEPIAALASWRHARDLFRCLSLELLLDNALHQLEYAALQLWALDPVEELKQCPLLFRCSTRNRLFGHVCTGLFRKMRGNMLGEERVHGCVEGFCNEKKALDRNLAFILLVLLNLLIRNADAFSQSHLGYPTLVPVESNPLAYFFGFHLSTCEYKLSHFLGLILQTVSCNIG